MTQVNLSWNSQTDASTFNIYDSTDGVHFATVKQGLSGSATSYQVTGLQPGTMYEFDVEAVGSDSSTADSYVTQRTEDREVEYTQTFVGGNTDGITGGSAQPMPPDVQPQTLKNTDWYEVAPTGSGSATISLPSVPFYTTAHLSFNLEVLNGASGTLTVSGPGRSYSINTANISSGYTSGNEVDDDGAGTGGTNLGDSMYILGMDFTSPGATSLTVTISGSVSGTDPGWGLIYAGVLLIAPWAKQSWCTCSLGVAQSVDPTRIRATRWAATTSPPTWPGRVTMAHRTSTPIRAG